MRQVVVAAKENTKPKAKEKVADEGAEKKRNTVQIGTRIYPATVGFHSERIVVLSDEGKGPLGRKMVALCLANPKTKAKARLVVDKASRLRINPSKGTDLDVAITALVDKAMKKVKKLGSYDAVREYLNGEREKKSKKEEYTHIPEKWKKYKKKPANGPILFSSEIPRCDTFLCLVKKKDQEKVIEVQFVTDYNTLNKYFKVFPNTKEGYTEAKEYFLRMIKKLAPAHENMEDMHLMREQENW